MNDWVRSEIRDLRRDLRVLYWFNVMILAGVATLGGILVATVLIHLH